MRSLFMAAAAVSAMLSGCASNSNAIRNDPQHKFNVVEVTFVSTKDISERFELARKHQKYGRIIAASEYQRGEPRCTIYARPPRHQRDIKAFESLGHELWHCLRGSWHRKKQVIRVQQ